MQNQNEKIYNSNQYFWIYFFVTAGQFSISTPPPSQYGLRCQDSGWSNLSWKTKLQMAWIEIAQSSWLLCSLQPCPNTATFFFSSHWIEVSAVQLGWSLRSTKNQTQTRWSSVVSQKELGGGAEDLFQHLKVFTEFRFWVKGELLKWVEMKQEG